MAFGKFGRYHPDGIDVQISEFDLVALVTAEVAAASASGPVGLTTDVPEWSLASDPLHVRYIVVNLLQNAIKYSDAQSVVIVEVKGGPNVGRVIVADNGIGIPPQDVEALFSPFFRASNVATRSGTGMGLAIVKKSASLIGARVSVDSEIGEGTTFAVSLPRAPTAWRA